MTSSVERLEQNLMWVVLSDYTIY